LVAKAVFSIFLSLVDFPELISIETNASVGLIIKYPPDFKFILGSKISFKYFSIPFEWNRGTFPLYFFIFLTCSLAIISAYFLAFS